MNWAYTFSGLSVGLLVGLTGVGGGSLMTPLLVFLFGFKPAVAVGTDLLFAAITKTGGVWVHHNKHSSVDWKIVGWLGLGSIPSALATLYVLKHLMDVGKETTGAITFTLGVALLLTASALIVRSILLSRAAKLNPIDDEHSNPENAGRFKHLQIPATVFIGVVLGILVTLSSVGAGALGTVALLFLYPRMTTLKIVGTDLAHAIPLTAVAGLGHLSLGNVDLMLLGSLLVGSIPGIWIGSHLSAKIPEKILRPILACVLMLIGLKFVLQ
ncbi:sulfite exporter TauE/SafE family protein [Candidatus Methylobacter oryzae]|uniref:Probable membrane transporter protein n=1 Tax=Candidatus Methylobacter oryzae TaxID=2497749 RepID=A0ABY3C861_9GAMM|nr:sulfite exporter TauE/SafE family protein [Candidatus Methylobacter oryzae]TRW92764.1 sulfite exporter TauE/SafE family protein [Candidatus Methylobacter oryzae]